MLQCKNKAVSCSCGTTAAEERKGAWRMPRLRKAMKDVASCEKRG